MRYAFFILRLFKLAHVEADLTAWVTEWTPAGVYYFAGRRAKVGVMNKYQSWSRSEIDSIFARISPNLPEKLFCDFCLQMLDHEDQWRF